MPAAPVLDSHALLALFRDEPGGEAIATRAGQTKTLPPAVKSVTSILRNHLDKQMLMFKKSNPEFYAGYVSARVIVDRGSRKSASPTPAPTPANTPLK